MSFSYAGARDTLHEVSFEAQPGQRIAIVGPTGAGKTTLMSLLVRFYDPRGGRIFLDGIDVRKLKLHSLRDADQPRPAGAAAVLGDHRREHPLRPARRDAWTT